LSPLVTPSPRRVPPARSLESPSIDASPPRSRAEKSPAEISQPARGARVITRRLHATRRARTKKKRDNSHYAHIARERALERAFRGKERRRRRIRSTHSGWELSTRILANDGARGARERDARAGRARERTSFCSARETRTKGVRGARGDVARNRRSATGGDDERRELDDVESMGVRTTVRDFACESRGE